jgi:hypothetical protein
MADGREERLQEELRRQEEQRRDREDRLNREDRDPWRPERKES